MLERCGEVLVEVSADDWCLLLLQRESLALNESTCLVVLPVLLEEHTLSTIFLELQVRCIL